MPLKSVLVSKVFWVVFLVIVSFMLFVPSFSQDITDGWMTIYSPRYEPLPSGMSCTMANRANMHGIPFAAVRFFASDGCGPMVTQIGFFGLLGDVALAGGVAALVFALVGRRGRGWIPARRPE